MKTQPLILLLLVLPIMLMAQNDTALETGKEFAMVDTNCGKVRGYSHDGTYIFKGIPYAQSERFMPPKKPESWEGVRSSMTYGPVCPIPPTTQVNDETEFLFQHNWGYHNEDCQNLNVWTPSINDDAKRPVMVWFHGGGFSAGSSIELPSYDGENISKNGDVVLVSVNHRLNVLGFLDLSAFGEKYRSSANVGLMDLVASLEWVKENIARFGGDPNNVTIFGQSGGGGKVVSLMSAPSAKGLFHKAIVQSGSFLRGFTEAETAQRVSAATLEELAISEDQIDSLQNIPYLTLHAIATKALQKVNEELTAEGASVGGFGLNWGPVLDGEFLPYQPTEDEAWALSSDIPLLVGSTKTEFVPFQPQNQNISTGEAEKRIKEQYGEQAEDYMAAVKEAYPETDEPSDYIDVDVRFRPGVVQHANQKSANGEAPVYAYLFTWESPVLDGVYKSIHCMELPFVFDNIDRCQEMTGGGEKAHKLADKMSRAWVNFARNGDPNYNDLPEWPAYTSENGATMIFDNQCKVRNHHDHTLLELASGN